jgi:thiamine monophosphate synthase
MRCGRRRRKYNRRNATRYVIVANFKFGFVTVKCTTLIGPPMTRAILRLIGACQEPETLLIVADHLDEAAREHAAAGASDIDLRDLEEAARHQAAHLKEPK